MAITKLKRTGESDRGALARFVASIAGPLAIVGVFSLLISLLVLTVPLYMMNLFDRVLTSMSVETLIALTAITLFLLLGMGALEAVRGRALVRMGVRFDEVMAERVFTALVQANIWQRVGGATLSQIDVVRGFLTGQGIVAFFDLPFTPIFLAVMFMMHPWLGILAVIGAVVVVAVALAAKTGGAQATVEGAIEQRRAAVFADTALRSSDTVAAMGMIGALRRRWLADHDAATGLNVRVSDRLANLNAMLKALVMINQVLIMGLACYLVIIDQTTPGALFAANVLSMRIIMPLQGAVSGWRGYLSAREALDNLQELLAAAPTDRDRVKLPRPKGHLKVEGVIAGPPGGDDAILHGVSCQVLPGQALGIMGPSGSGKTSLARLMVGLWKTMRGNIRLDGADVHSWEFDDLGQYIGYVPQEIDLFNGTIAENICRFGERDDARIVTAAKVAGVHEIILQQAQGYDTEIRGKGGVLSGGQRQRLAIARAIYGEPQLIVLDEPNSNLDRDGERDLLRLIDLLKEKGRTVVVISHDPKLVNSVDKILYLQHGKSAAYGARDKVLAKLGLAPPRPAAGGVLGVVKQEEAKA